MELATQHHNAVALDNGCLQPIAYTHSMATAFTFTYASAGYVLILKILLK